MTDSQDSFLTRPLRTIFLDRDGVVNRKLPEGRYVMRVSEFEPLPGVPEAIGRLNQAGLRVVVVTNQRGIAMGLYSAFEVGKIHAAFQKTLEAKNAHVDAFYFCPHDKLRCDCRKPLPGLYHQAVAQFPEIAAESSAMIGDSWSDIEFGRRLGMTTIFIEGDATTRKSGTEMARDVANFSCDDLPQAVDKLLGGVSSAEQQ